MSNREGQGEGAPQAVLMVSGWKIEMHEEGFIVSTANGETEWHFIEGSNRWISLKDPNGRKCCIDGNIDDEGRPYDLGAFFGVKPHGVNLLSR